MLSEKEMVSKCNECLECWSYQMAAACLDAQRRVITNATAYANDRIHLTAISEFGAIRSKLAEMATLVMLVESATYRASKILKIECS
jgi:alkylation response protein AidB-like acyl-CoA dehydrogenase